MSSSREVWEKYWNSKVTNDESKIFGLIDALLSPLNMDEKKFVLTKPISLFRSISIVYRWIHYNFFNIEEDNEEIVKVIEPLDLPNIDIKSSKTFSNSGDLSPYNTHSRELFKDWCLNQISQVDPNLPNRTQRFDLNEMKMIKNYWDNAVDYELYENYQYTLKNFESSIKKLDSETKHKLEEKIISISSKFTKEDTRSFTALILSNNELRDEILAISDEDITKYIEEILKRLKDDNIQYQQLKSKLIFD